MTKSIIHWSWVPRYYRKVDLKSNDIGIVYWYFGLETVFIVVMAFVFYFTTISDGFKKKNEMDSQVESLRRSIGNQIQPNNPIPSK